MHQTLRQLRTQCRQTWRLIAVLLGGLLLITACSPAAPQTPTVDPNTVLTQAAQTVAAQLTMNPPATSTPTNPPLPSPTSGAPTATIAPPSALPTATNTNPPASSNPPAGSTQDNAAFVADVTIPDGTGAAPGVQFEKIWRIKNTGQSTWTTAYSLVPIDGEKMASPDSIAMPKEVRPGETVEISVKLTAPTKPGSYQTFFRLRNAAGQYFRMDGTGDLWLKITVGGVTATPNLTETAIAPTPTVTATTPAP